MGAKAPVSESNNEIENKSQEKPPQTTDGEAWKQFKKVEEPRLTKEEEIELKYRGRKDHPDCKKAIYAKGREHIKKLFRDHECCEMGPSQHLWDDYSGYAGCDNCILLWKRDDEEKEKASTNQS
jgi:hypothetical protein